MTNGNSSNRPRWITKGKKNFYRLVVILNEIDKHSVVYSFLLHCQLELIDQTIFGMLLVLFHFVCLLKNILINQKNVRLLESRVYAYTQTSICTCLNKSYLTLMSQLLATRKKSNLRRLQFDTTTIRTGVFYCWSTTVVFLSAAEILSSIVLSVMVVDRNVHINLSDMYIGLFIY